MPPPTRPAPLPRRRRRSLSGSDSDAIRYAIPTAIIGCSSYEIAGRYHLWTDIWVHPEKFGLVLGLRAGALAIAAFLAVRTPAHAKRELQA